MDDKEVAVVGMPRCGTTYLFRCIAGLKPGPGSPKGKALASLPVMKCHSLAPPNSFDDPWSDQLMWHCINRRKVIWVFGDPIAAVVSTMKKRFDHVHAKNCGCITPLDRVNLLIKDWFNYELMFDTWTSEPAIDYPVLCVRYEKMWENRFVIEWFLGREVKWNEWNLRKWKPEAILPENIYNQLTDTYSSLMQKIDCYPDVTLNGENGIRISGDIARMG